LHGIGTCPDVELGAAAGGLGAGEEVFVVEGAAAGEEDEVDLLVPVEGAPVEADTKDTLMPESLMSIDSLQ
jgi:hypothetical protein